MSLHLEYEGLDEVVIGDGIGLNATHIGSTKLSIPSQKFTLMDFCVLSIHHILIYVNKFTSSNNCSIEFTPISFSVKDLKMGVHLLHCKCKDDIYYMS